MKNAFASILQARPCPTFGRPVRLRGGPHRLRPGTSPQALRIPPRGGHPALRSLTRAGSRSPLAVSGFPLRARLELSIPVSLFGQRGITPAFGYDAPHPSAGGTQTLPINALPGAHYQPVRLPTSAQRRAVVLPRATPPTGTSPSDPVGSPGFRCRPFVRDTVLDPGGATPPRDSGDAHTAFALTNTLGLHDFGAFGADFLHPARLLSTLRTRRYRRARKTRFSPACYGFGDEGLSPSCQTSASPSALVIPTSKPSDTSWLCRRLPVIRCLRVVRLDQSSRSSSIRGATRSSTMRRRGANTTRRGSLSSLYLRTVFRLTPSSRATDRSLRPSISTLCRTTAPRTCEITFRAG